MKIIGLTGGIGTGKSTVSNYLKSKNFVIIDADKISHYITEKDASTLSEIIDSFGNGILNQDGTLDRKALGRIVFNDDNKKRLLEKIVTNKVIEIVKSSLESYDREGLETVVLDAPLLFETKMDIYCNEIWTVTANQEQRVKRLIDRDGLTKDEILSRSRNQLSDEIKCSKSDIILKNDKDLDYLYAQIEAAMEKLND